MCMHEKPGIPWVKVGTDLFEVDGKTFLIISDYFIHYPVVKELHSTTTAAVITATKEAFGIFV